MKLLFVTPQLPFPPKSGGAIRSSNIILSVSKERQAKVFSLGSFKSHQTISSSGSYDIEARSFPVISRSAKRRALDLITKNVPDMALRLYSPALARAVEDAIEGEGFDLVQIEGLESAPSLANVISKRNRPPIVYDTFNAEYQLQKRAFQTDSRNPSRWAAALYSLVQWQRLASYEKWLCNAVDAVTVVSKEDKEAILTLAPEAKVTVVPSGVDIERYTPERSKPVGAGSPHPGSLHPYQREQKNILFTGTMDYRPNIDAMKWFCAEIFPVVLQQMPDAHLWIVGRDPAPVIKRLAGPNVTVTGEVEDDLPYFHRTNIFVLPMRYGGGVRLKLLQAMSCGLPVVSTPAGLEGVSVRDGENVVTANNSKEFANKVVQALENPELAGSIGMNARKKVEESYSWESVLKPLQGLYDSLLTERPNKSS